MFKRIFCASVLCVLCVSIASAQTVRFDTNVGTFDMELNPTGNVGLQGHVDNMLAYVNAGRYIGMVINRVNEVTAGGPADFVMQMGGFLAGSSTLPSSFSDFRPIATFNPVITDRNGDGAIDFSTAGLTNSRGTISLALSGAGPNSGTSSFFINLNDIPSLDPGGAIGEFVPFAIIPDMTTVDLIQSFDTASLAGGGVGSSNIPILDGNTLVIVERAFVLDQPSGAPAASAAPGSVTAPSTAAAQSSSTVPEPSSLMLAAGALALLAISRRGKIA